MKIEFMQEICDKLNIDLMVGDYDYAACYTREEYDSNEHGWRGRWFGLKCEFALIFIPTKYSPTEQAFGFFHELGHIIDHLEHVEFDTTWDCEVSAWKWAWAFCRMYKWDDKQSFVDDVTVCLGTYNKHNHYNIHNAFNAIGLNGTDNHT